MLDLFVPELSCMLMTEPRYEQDVVLIQDAEASAQIPSQLHTCILHIILSILNRRVQLETHAFYKRLRVSEIVGSDSKTFPKLAVQQVLCRIIEVY